MLKKISIQALLLLTLQAQAAENQNMQEISADVQDTDEAALRRKGCETFCCINVTGNEFIGGNLTVGGDITVGGSINSGNINITEDLIVNGQSVNELFTFGNFFVEEEEEEFRGITRALPPTPPNDPVSLPGTAASSGGVVPDGSTTFILPRVGKYKVSFALNTAVGQVNAEVAIFVNNVKIPYTVSSKINSNGSVTNVVIVNAPIKNSALQLRNTGLDAITIAQGSLVIQYLSK